jgi:hypothetical protein
MKKLLFAVTFSASGIDFSNQLAWIKDQAEQTVNYFRIMMYKGYLWCLL